MDQAKLKIWFLAARPKTLPAAVGPVLVGSAMAYSEGGFNTLVFFVTIAAALLIQVGTNFANDYYDYVKGADTAGRTGPVRATQAGLVTPAEMKQAFIVTFLAALILGCYLVYTGGIAIVIIGIMSILCGVLYTGGPYPLGYIGLGEVFVLIFFGPVAVGGTYFLQTASIKAAVILVGLAPGFLATAILVVNNFRDVHTDRTVGKKTLAVRFGYRFTVIEYISSIAIACLIPVILCLCIRSHYRCLISLLTLIPAQRSIRTFLSGPEAAVLNELLADTGKLLAIFCVLFSVGWVL